MQSALGLVLLAGSFPLFVGAAEQEPGSPWTVVFQVAGAVCLVAAIVLLVLGRRKKEPSSGGRVGINAEDSEIDLEDSSIKNQDVGMHLRRSKYRGKRTDIE